MTRKPISDPTRNPALLVAAVVGGMLVIGLLVLVLLRRPAAEPERPVPPAARQMPSTGGQLAPVYGGGARSGRPRTGF